MRFALVIVLLCGIVGQATIRTAWTLHYQFNRAAYLAKCVNKDKPYLHCNGQCAFMKEMAAREKSQEPQLPESFQQIKDIQLFFEPAALLPLFSEKILLKATLPPYQWAMMDPPVRGLLKPPA
ncbi:MAG TPA: hypothetical protein VK168_03230 [Saprospiraceae bacterium]|nr:hypothetical protein [Saprospiraceae bacterium]